MSRAKARRSRARKPMAEREPTSEAEALREALLWGRVDTLWRKGVMGHLTLVTEIACGLERIMRHRFGVTDEEVKASIEEFRADLALIAALHPVISHAIEDSARTHEEMRRIFGDEAQGAPPPDGGGRK